MTNKNKIADYLAYCNATEYEKYQHDNGNFILNIDAFIKGENLQSSVCGMLSKEFDTSHIMTDLTRLENELVKSESTMKEILQF